MSPDREYGALVVEAPRGPHQSPWSLIFGCPLLLTLSSRAGGPLIKPHVAAFMLPCAAATFAIH